jgi:hypothetical protein
LWRQKGKACAEVIHVNLSFLSTSFYRPDLWVEREEKYGKLQRDSDSVYIVRGRVIQCT